MGTIAPPVMPDGRMVLGELEGGTALAECTIKVIVEIAAKAAKIRGRILVDLHISLFGRLLT